MELWVRSQLKEFLIKVNDLRIMQLTEDGFEIGEKTDDWFIVANDDPCVGKYKSKQRALEILDEIENFMLCNKEYKYTTIASINELGGCYIYQMPEE